MKPFLTITVPEAPSFEEFVVAMKPFGSYLKPSHPINLIGAEILKEVEESVKTAKLEFNKMKKCGAQASGSGGLEPSWEQNINSILASCVSAGVTAAALWMDLERSSRMDVGGTLKMSLLEPGKRYHDWWIVPQIVREKS